MSGCVTLLMSVALMLVWRKGRRLRADTNRQRERERERERGKRKKLMQGCSKERNLLNDWCMRRKINDGDFKHEPRGFLFFFPFLVFSVNGHIVRSAFLFSYF